MIGTLKYLDLTTIKFSDTSWLIIVTYHGSWKRGSSRVPLISLSTSAADFLGQTHQIIIENYLFR